MSRTLKRPMFRKGGEVMEGVMTGIKPRESFQDKGMSNEMAEQVKNVRNRMNLIDAVAGAGASPLGNPLTQFLLQTGANLISGESAGGTKLQELVGATRKPLAAAVKQQQLKDLSRRKLAATLISKSGGDDISKIKRNAKKIAKETGRDENEVFNSLLNKFMYQDEKSPGTIAQQSKDQFKKALLAETDVYGKKVNKPPEADAITNAYFRIKDKKGAKIDNTMFNIPKKELAKLEPITVKVGDKDRKGFKPSGNVVYQDDTIYYDVRGKGKYLIYDKEQDVLIALK